MDGSYRDRYAKQYEGLVGSLAPQKKKRDQFGEMLQNISPFVAPALTAAGAGLGLVASGGNPMGAAIGGSLGGAAGQALGLQAGEIGASRTQEYDEEEMRRAALFNALMGMR